MSEQPIDSPRAVLQDGYNRARHILVAVVMIVYLLGRLLLVKIIWARVRILLAWLSFHFANGLLRIYSWLLPHWERYKELALQTTNRWLRAVLKVLIEALMPLERPLVRLGGVLKAHTERVAVRSAVSMAELLRAIFGAIGTFFASGFNRPAARKFLQRLSELLEEAQK